MSIPAWIEHYYGVRAAADGDSAAHAAVAAMLASRALVLSTAPVFLVADPQLRTALVTLARADTYLRHLRGWADLPNGTVMFTDPIPFRHPSPDQVAAERFPLLEGNSDAATPLLKALTWFTDSDAVRCLDWIAPQIDSTGSEVADSKVAESMRGLPRGGLPPMIGNGEWSRTVTTIDDIAVCRERIAVASAELGVGAGARWDGTTIEDDTTTLAPTLAAVLADAITAGLVTQHTRRAKNAKLPMITTLQPPARP
ncbi:hypothetical protein [Gordonia alkanivorans]|uniref:hypothetical protein n=1 Tax=Gordonia alkanivorans TaxID=84096 RepID=UPI0012DEA920|nr:hypothetical protein [Gordonia alkanivorans]